MSNFLIKEYNYFSRSFLANMILARLNLDEGLGLPSHDHDSRRDPFFLCIVINNQCLPGVPARYIIIYVLIDKTMGLVSFIESYLAARDNGELSWL